MLLVAGTMLYHLGGRLETPAVKEERIKRIVQPIRDDVKDLQQRIGQLNGQHQTHERQDGHYAMIERVNALLRRLDKLERDLENHSDEQ